MSKFMVANETCTSRGSCVFGRRVLFIGGLSSVSDWYADCLLGQGRPYGSGPDASLAAQWGAVAVERVSVAFDMKADAFSGFEAVRAALASGRFGAVVLSDVSWKRAVDAVEVSMRWRQLDFPLYSSARTAGLSPSPSLSSPICATPSSG